MNKPKIRPCLEKIKPYVPGKPVEEVERELGLTGVIKLASNENPLGPSKAALRALEGHLERLHQYPDSNCFYLKEALAGRLGVRPEQLVVGNGSDEILRLITTAYINPGDQGLMVFPTFSEYEFALRLCGGEPRYVQLIGDDFQYDLEALAEAVNQRTRLVFICSPNNPTGSVALRPQLDRFLGALPPGVLTVLDYAYCEYVDEPAYPSGLEYVREGLPVIVLRTFSKIYGLAGLRIGYAIAPAAVVEDLNRVREPFNVNSLAQAAALGALEDEAHLRRSRELVAAGRRQLAEGLARLGLRPVPSQANFCFIDVKMDSRTLFRELLKRGVIVRTGDIFGYPTYIRVTYGTGEQNRRFLRALGEVLAEPDKD